MLYIYTGNPKPEFPDKLEGSGMEMEVERGLKRRGQMYTYTFVVIWHSHAIVKLYPLIKNKIKLKIKKGKLMEEEELR